MWEKKETYPFGQTGRPAVPSRSVSPSYFCLQTGSWPHSRPCRGMWTSFTSRHPLSSPSNRLACLRVSGGSHLRLNNERCLAGLNFTVTSRASFNALLECMISNCMLSYMDIVCVCTCLCTHYFVVCSGFPESDFNNHATCGF